MNKKVFGIFMVALAIAYLASKIWVPEVRLWAIVGGLFFLITSVYNLVKRHFTAGLVLLALAYVSISKVFFFSPFAYFSGLSFWTIFLFAILLGCGLDVIFGKSNNQCKTKVRYNRNGQDYVDVEYQMNEDNIVDVYCKFGAIQQYVQTHALTGGKINVQFGGAVIHFEQAALAEAGANINIDCSFGSIELYIPREWSVQNNVASSLSSIDDDRFGVKDGTLPTLVLNGKISLSSLQIIYV